MRLMEKALVYGLVLGLMSFTSYAAEPSYDWFGRYAAEKGIRTEGFNFATDWSEGLAEAYIEWKDLCAPYSSIVIPDRGIFMKDKFNHYDYVLGCSLHESEYMEKWLSDNMKNIVPEGVGVDDAVKICYKWIIDHCTYEHKDFYSQRAITIVTEGKASCVAYSSLFKMMVNYLNFDKDWKVVYSENIGPGLNQLNMLVICDTDHAWNSIEWIDGSWKYFDLTWDDSRTEFFRDEIADMEMYSSLYYMKNEEEFYADGEHKKVENIEGISIIIEEME